ncbi:hypothetical protein OOK31_16030 [Streptomyces sp. NBC_00249]|uniref:hypothetical protein n=1 Tax=Streptomyces sp. NBC_00249 TaxID=2975690 RepID=UPI0022504EF9|nr:hypothetical protein [Streptomyces sp. NBC_00249]MCX5195392.1 hypothetical protein [Streptomyces sp. NBC_00249]
MCTAALVLTLLQALAGATPAAAVTDDRPFATWNMQGANEGANTNKWTTYIPTLFNSQSIGTQTHSIVALQEMASPPASSVPTQTHSDVPVTYAGPAGPVNGDVRVYHNTWTRNGENYSLYWAITDSNGEPGLPARVNVGILVNTSRLGGAVPEPVVVQPDALGGTLPRPLIGVRVGTDSYYSIHALSGGGNDRNNAIRAVAARHALQGGAWVVAGDFNFDLQRGVWVPPSGHLRNPGQITHEARQPGGNDTELDYAVSSAPAANGWEPHTVWAGSDHYAVSLNRLHAAGETETGFTYRIRSESLGVMQTASESTANEVPVNATDWGHRLSQVWKTIRGREIDGTAYHQLVNMNSNKCLDVVAASYDPSSHHLRQTDCHANPGKNQLWRQDPASHVLSNGDGLAVAPDPAAPGFLGGVVPAVHVASAWQLDPVDLRFWETGGFQLGPNFTITNVTTSKELSWEVQLLDPDRLGEYEAKDTDQHHWRFEASGTPGGVRIVNLAGNVCLEKPAPDPGGEVVRMASCSPSPSQQWEEFNGGIRNRTGGFLVPALEVSNHIPITMLRYTSAPEVRYRITPNFTPPPNDGRTELLVSSPQVEKAYDFLSSTMDEYGSNSALRVPRSYAGGHFAPGEEFGPDGYQASFTYDNALIIAAFLKRGTSGDISHAVALGDSLLYAQAHDIDPDGRIRASYEPNPFVTATGSPYVGGFSVYTGNMAWAGMAFTRLYKATGQQRFLDGALRTANWIQTNAADSRGIGGYTGGLRNTDETGAQMQHIDWKATEHNIDTGSFFAMLAGVTGEAAWRQRSDNAFAFVRSMQADDGRLWTGTGNDGVTQNRDTVPEDIQAWSYLATLDPAYSRSIDWAATNLAATDGPYTGVSFGRTDTSKVWFEGTAHMLAAYNQRRAPDDGTRAATLLDTLKRAQNEAPNTDGRAIVAASSDGLTTGEGDIYYASRHTGATAWFLLAAQGGNPFRL